MAKEPISKISLSRDEVSALVAQFGFPLPLAETAVLFGGYSGTSIKVVSETGERAVLKVCHGYSAEDAEAQAAIAVHARAHGFAHACTALPVAGGGARHTVALPGVDATPAMLLSWVEGVSADKVVAAGAVSPAAVLRSLGAGLAGLHSVPVDAAAARALRPLERGGACDVAKHLSGEIHRTLAASPHARDHAFFPFYERQLGLLRAAMATEGLPRGLLHGDPFLDNALVSAADGSLAGWVDLEDVAVGPTLFDVACCACAACFRADNALDLRRLRALLSGYVSVRPLAAAERSAFVSFMKATMLCNCAWRFKNFNLDHREIEECRESYRELQTRILELEQPEVVAEVQAVVAELARHGQGSE